MKRKIDDLTKTERIETLDALYTAAGTLRGRDAMKAFLRDLLTESERVMLGRRIIIARLLLQGETYQAIAERMKVGMDTIHKVDRWLQDSLPGLETAVAGLEQEKKKRAARRDPYSFESLKKKYPLHFLLFTIADELKKPTVRKRIPRKY